MLPLMQSIPRWSLDSIYPGLDSEAFRKDLDRLEVDGTRLEDVTDLKRYLLKNIDIFSRCLTSKLLVYATGRPTSFGDKRVVDRIVGDVKSHGNGFRDLIVTIVLGEAFGVK